MKKITIVLVSLFFSYSLTAQSPTNDTCSGAITLQVNNDTCQNPYTDNNTNATDSQQGGNVCATPAGGDLWYQVVVPNSGTLTLETSGVSGSNISDTAIAAYSGDCSNLTLLPNGCNDDGAGMGAFSKLELINLTPGETIYVRVLLIYQGITGDFHICAYDPQASSIAQNNLIEFKIYPNPADNQINISAKQKLDYLKIYDLSGKKIMEIQPENLNTSIDIHKLNKGIYFIKAFQNGNVSTGKFIKK